MALKLRGHKYGAKPVTIDGIRFASTAEGRRYQELKMLEKAGAIVGLELQPRFPLTVPCAMRLKVETIGEYRGDFSYHELGRRVVEDVKGVDTPLSKWKRKHVAAQYGITVQIVKSRR